MLSPAFDRNPIGVEYDPDDLVKRFEAGVPVAELVVRDSVMSPRPSLVPCLGARQQEVKALHAPS